VLDRQRPHVVVTHSCWTHALFAPVVRRRRLPLVFFAHGLPSGRSWLESWAGGSPPDLALANSRATRAGLPLLFGNVPAEVVYLPLPQPELPDRAACRQRVRGELAVADGTALLLMASRLERLKGHEVLLDALGSLRHEAGWVCAIAGGPQRPAEERFLQELLRRCQQQRLEGRVHWLGDRRDVPRLLAAADLYCQPNTEADSFGLVFVEALYAGLPVVTTALGGSMEIIDASCGVLLPPADPEALAAALGELILNPERRLALGRAGPARARSLCNPGTQMHTLHRLLARLTSPQNPVTVPLDLSASGVV
jgi:glycosyltransferase involved in cell wall biosynthesis